ncbi:MAG TPA: hypothetical protein VHS09_01330 [Polyangiaceae bacterium]|jgi:hypothetical protein|nr:hypothetical protein [Polyangiaceae bacterium]
MHRFLAATLLASSVGISLGACGDDSSDVGYAYGAGGGGYTSDCTAYTSCGTCTPVLGCGWCFTAAGGACASDPDSCGDASEFTWTWDPTGCPGADASVAPATPPDAGHD